MTGPVSYEFKPPEDLSFASFDKAMKKIGEADFYILVCHKSLRWKAQSIKEGLRLRRNLEVDIVSRDEGQPFAWFVHGMNNQGPPFCIGTLVSNVPS